MIRPLFLTICVAFVLQLLPSSAGHAADPRGRRHCGVVNGEVITVTKVRMVTAPRDLLRSQPGQTAKQSGARAAERSDS
jgi:hypothetical protein